MVAVREIVLGIGLAVTADGEDPTLGLLSAAAIDGAECLVVLGAVARRQLPAVPALGFAAADVGGALVAVGVLAQRRRARAARGASAGTSGRQPGASPEPERPS